MSATGPFSSTKPWPSVWVLKISVSLLAPGSTAVARPGWGRSYVAVRVSRAFGRVADWPRSFAPVSRST